MMMTTCNRQQKKKLVSRGVVYFYLGCPDEIRNKHRFPFSCNTATRARRKNACKRTIRKSMGSGDASTTSLNFATTWRKNVFALSLSLSFVLEKGSLEEHNTRPSLAVIALVVVCCWTGVGPTEALKQAGSRPLDSFLRCKKVYYVQILIANITAHPRHTRLLPSPSKISSEMEGVWPHSKTTPYLL